MSSTTPAPPVAPAAPIAPVTTVAPERAGKHGFRGDIQGLRAFAVVAVILDHLLGWPAGGFVGVDVFFVISGYLITSLLLREHERTGSISFKGFYRNRLRRIAPAATLVLLSTILAARFLFNADRLSSTALDALASFFFVANWRYASVGTDYFQATGPESPLQHFWSLAVEEQFYFIWPWLMLLVFFLVKKRRSRGSIQARTVLTAIMILLIATTFAWGAWETQFRPTVAYFSTITRTWELGVGALLAVSGAMLTGPSARFRAWLGWLGFAGLIASLIVISEASAFPVPWAALPVLATASIIIAGSGDHGPRIWPLVNPVSRYIGDISYSLYLWHFPVIIFFQTLVGGGFIQNMMCLAVFGTLSVYSFHLLEDPIRRSKFLLRKPRLVRAGSRRRRKRRNTEVSVFTLRYRLTALSFAGLVIVALVAGAVHQQTPVTANVPRFVPQAGDQDDPLADQPELASLQNEVASALRATDWPDLDPTLDEVIAGLQTPKEILPCGFITSVESECIFGNAQGPRTIVAVGSSISMTYIETLRTALGDSGWRVIPYGMFGCPFADYSILPESDQGTREGCGQRPDEAVEAINRLQPDLVFISGILTASNAASEVAKVSSPATKFVVLPGPPSDKNVAECYTPISHPADCISEVPDQYADADRGLAKRIGATFIDPQMWYCVGGQCPAFVGSFPVKLDAAHITAAYARRIAPVLREFLVQREVIDAPAA
ncbi:acyltransferase family protein [Naasia lichenicola]|uniref:Acyltransferase n=1 Tax=Naasia lichenicola TaxID=2565933 RepID=A0A4S4FK65_9MICO|nr:acyltransferase family protein [Naasia lichenicola]THG30770.1 acyltransferase [Naasia lichenicola]THG32007.1 acyltransferase [Naasia lichenicola]